MNLAPKKHRNVTLGCALKNPLPTRRKVLDAFDHVFNDWLPEVKDGGPYKNTTTRDHVELSINITKEGSGRRCSVDDFNRLFRALKLEALGQIDQTRR